VQLDRVPPRRIPPPEGDAAQIPASGWDAPGYADGLPLSGTVVPPAGVPTDVRSWGDGTAPRTSRGLLASALVALAAFALLGPGERCRVDARFASPSATLATYWSALRDGDSQTMAECMLDDSEDQPFPGMLWFMPPTREVRLEEFRSLPVSAGRIMVTYQVRFRPLGALEEQSFQTGHELVRDHGMWRITRGLGPASLPAWRPIPRAVDS
jgi:hypothetical protein